MLAPQAVGCTYTLITKRTLQQQESLSTHFIQGNAVTYTTCCRHPARTLEDVLPCYALTGNIKIADICAHSTQVGMQVLGPRRQRTGTRTDSAASQTIIIFAICGNIHLSGPHSTGPNQKNRLDAPQMQQQPCQEKTPKASRLFVCHMLQLHQGMTHTRSHEVCLCWQSPGQSRRPPEPELTTSRCCQRSATTGAGRPQKAKLSW